MATKTENETTEGLLSELWAEIEGSYEADQRAIRQAVQGSKLFGKTTEEWDLNVEATFKDEVIVVNMRTNPKQYYKAKWGKDDTGKVLLSDVKTVEAKVVLEALDRQEEVITAVRQATNTVPINETFVSPMKLNEVTGSDGKTRTVGSVEVAQEAGVVNGNDRRYRKQVLKEAIDDIQRRMGKHGPLLMDSKHRTKIGKDGTEKNETDLRETVAVIKEVSWHEESSTVSLDEIEFVDTPPGNEIKALAEAGVQLQVSQRASGVVELVKDSLTERLIQDVVAFKITGWDFVAPGEASVDEANVKFEVVSESEVSGMAELKVPTLEEVQALITASNDKLKAEVIERIEEGIKDGFSADAIVESLKKAGILPEKDEEDPAGEAASAKDGTPAGDGTPAAAPTDAPAAAPAGAPGTGTPDPVDNFMPEIQADVQGLTDRVDGLTATLGERTEELNALRRDKELVILTASGAEILAEALGAEAYARFTPKQKEVLLESVSVESVHGAGDLVVTDREAVKAVLVPLLTNEITKMDAFIAATKVEEMGYPRRGTGEGITHVEVLSESLPNAEYVAKIRPVVVEKLTKKLHADHWVMPEGHPAEKFLNEMLHKYDQMYWPLMRKEERLMNEANEEVLQLDIGVRVATLSRIVIEEAYRRLTALQICDLGTMTNRIEDLLISSWLPAETTDIADDMSAVEIAQGDTIPTAGITYTNTPIYAIWRPLRTYISSNAKATARNTAMNPEADAIAGLSLDLQRRVDRYLWQLMITYTQLRDDVEVSSWETLSTTTVTNEYQAANQGWLRYEVLQTQDANNNPTGQKLGKLYAAPAGNTLTPVEIQEGGDDNTPLIYATDYSVNWADGSIILTATGVTKMATNGIRAKYTYSTAGTKFWSVVPPTGVTLYSHLINLRQEIGAAKVLVGNRNYAPNFIGMALEIEDLVTSGPQFTASGATASDMLSRLNEVMSYAGLRPIRTSAIDQQWIVVAEEGSCVYRVHTPWSLRGPITDKDTGYDYYLGEEYTGAIVPVDDKLALVGITDLNST